RSLNEPPAPPRSAPLCDNSFKNFSVSDFSPPSERPLQRSLNEPPGAPASGARLCEKYRRSIMDPFGINEGAGSPLTDDTSASISVASTFTPLATQEAVARSKARSNESIE